MGYITAADVRTKVWLVTETEVSNDIVNEAVAMAAADIDSKLGSMYTVPFDPVPDVISAINNALVRYYGQFLKGHVYENMSEQDRRAYDWATAKLEALKKGEEIIPNVSARGKRVRCSTSDYHRAFNLDDPKNWDVDDDQLDDIADGRD